MANVATLRNITHHANTKHGRGRHIVWNSHSCRAVRILPRTSHSYRNWNILQTCFVAHDDPDRTTAQSTATTQTSLLSFFEDKDTDGHCLELKQLRMTTAPGEEFLTSGIRIEIPFKVCSNPKGDTTGTTICNRKRNSHGPKLGLPFIFRTRLIRTIIPKIN